MAKKETQVEQLHPFIGHLAVVGLVASSFMAILGVATVGVEAQVAFAPYQSSVEQTAVALLSDSRPVQHAPMMPASTTSPVAKPPMPPNMGSSTQPTMASSTRPMTATSTLLHDNRPPQPPQLQKGGYFSTSTRPVVPPPPRLSSPPPATSTARQVSMQDFEGSSNAANVISAVGEITDGVVRLGQASLSLLGL